MMISNKNIKKAFSHIEIKIIIMLLIVVSFNLLINAITAFVFSSSDTAIISFTKQIVHYITLFCFVYILCYGITLSATVVPYLISLNCPKKALGKTVIYSGIIRSIIISILVIVISHVFIIKDSMLIKSIFGIRIASFEIIDIVRLFITVILFSFSIFNIIMYLIFTGQQLGWQILLASIFTMLGIIFLLYKQIFLLFAFGANLNLVLIIVSIINIIMFLVNYLYVKNYEYKY